MLMLQQKIGFGQCCVGRFKVSLVILVIDLVLFKPSQQLVIKQFANGILTVLEREFLITVHDHCQKLLCQFLSY